MKNILITGANKGIGLATAEAVLSRRDDSRVLLGSRDAGRGRAAVDSLCDRHPDWQPRLDVLALDVADPHSVETARDTVIEQFGADPAPLYGLVNNAGIGLGSEDLARVLAVNTLGPKRVCDAFIPLLQPAGRVVNVSSASGPNFVHQCSASRRAFFLDASLDWADIQGLIDAVIDAGGDTAQLRSLELGECSAYGLSKACLSLYTLILARQHPELVINACTPGYIETDLTRPQAQLRGAAPEELGMKPPAEGTRAPLFLLFDTPQGSGHYYGSDARRSPLDRYRAPGSPAYTGD